MPRPTSTRKSAPTSEADESLIERPVDPAFPVWDIPATPSPKRMSPADYLAFVDFCWEHCTDKARARRERDKQVPVARFVL